MTSASVARIKESRPGPARRPAKAGGARRGPAIPRPEIPKLIVIIKLFFSAASACFAIGYAARRRANALHRPVMTLGLALAWAGVAVLLVGRLGLGLPLPPAYWLPEALGSARAASILATVQQAVGAVALLALSAQALLGRERHPLHRPLAWAALPLWIVTWVTTLFGYLG